MFNRSYTFVVCLFYQISWRGDFQLLGVTGWQLPKDPRGKGRGHFVENHNAGKSVRIQRGPGALQTQQTTLLRLPSHTPHSHLHGCQTVSCKHVPLWPGARETLRPTCSLLITRTTMVLFNNGPSSGFSEWGTTGYQYEDLHSWME